MKYRFLLILFATSLTYTQTVYAFDAPNATASTQTFQFGEKTFPVSAINFRGYNYVKLEDLCKSLNIDVALDWPNRTVYMDKTKAYSGLRPLNGTLDHECRVIGGLDKQWPGAFTSTSPETAELKGLKVITAFIEDKTKERGLADPDSGPGLDLLNINGINYCSLLTFAFANNIEVSFNVDTNTVLLDKTKPWVSDLHNDWNWWIWVDRGVRYIDAAGEPVFRKNEALSGKYSTELDVFQDGVLMAAQYEAHPYADIYRVTEYATSPDFPIREFVLYDTGFQFRFPASAPGAENLGKALSPVLNRNNVWSNDFLRRQRQVISVIINGIYADGFLEGGGPTNGEPAFYQYIFAKPYPRGGLQTLRIEIHGSQNQDVISAP